MGWDGDTMPAALSPAKVNEIERLLASGMSQRLVSERAGVSRCTVSNIASGKWTGRQAGYQGERAPRTAAPKGPLVRCPTCGGKVMLPCIACQNAAMEMKAKQV